MSVVHNREVQNYNNHTQTKLNILLIIKYLLPVIKLINMITLWGKEFQILIADGNL